MPSVSIITPTYNRAHYLKEAVESVISQTYQDWELFVVDDGSTDHTFQVMEEYIKKDKRIHYIKQQNTAAAAARNRALAEARGEYIAFLDDDDQWLPEKLQTQVKLMESNPSVGFCYMRFQIYKKIQNELNRGTIFPQFLATKFEDLFDAFIAPSSAMFRKKYLDETGWFDLQFERCEDFELWLRLGQICKIAPIDRIGAFTIMDGRPHGANSELKVWEIGIDILRNLKLIPKYQHRKRLIRTQIAKRYYWIAREYLDEKMYFKAAFNFARAILTDPMIGLAVRRSEKGNFAQILKPYAAIPISFVKGLIHGAR